MEEAVFGPVIEDYIAIDPQTLQISFTRDLRRGQPVFSQSFIGNDFVSVTLTANVNSHNTRIWLERLVNGQWQAVGGSTLMTGRTLNFGRDLPVNGTYRIGMTLDAGSPHATINIQANGRFL